MKVPPNSRERVLDFLNELGAHSVWQVSYVNEELNKCGLDSRVDIDGRTLWLGNSKVSASTPEWGDAGIYAPSVLAIIIENECFIEPIETDMTGRGFRHRHILQQLAARWKISKDFL